MKVEELNMIKDKLAEIMLGLYKELESFRQSQQLKGKLGSGAWLLGVDKAVNGWVSYLPHVDPNEEAIEIELFIDPRKENKPGTIELSLGWSHGITIKEYISRGISAMDGAQVAIEAEELFEKFREQIIHDMEAEMSLERQPVYREE